MKTTYLEVEIQKAQTDQYDATFVLSAATKDRMGDTIDPEAYLPNLKKKLIALWQHDSDKPMGEWKNLRVEGKKLIADLKIAGTNLGAMIRQLLSDKVPLGASIGFRGKGNWKEDDSGMHFTEIDLLECSIVSIPAHPAAILIGKSYKSDDLEDLITKEVLKGTSVDANLEHRMKAHDTLELAAAIVDKITKILK